MIHRPDNRAVRALLWFVILFVPGGVVLLAWFAAEAVQRRYPRAGAGADPDLTNASLPGVAGGRG